MGCARAPRRIRTADPFITNEVLYQLSYWGYAAVRVNGRGVPRKVKSSAAQRARSGTLSKSTQWPKCQRQQSLDLRNVRVTDLSCGNRRRMNRVGR